MPGAESRRTFGDALRDVYLAIDELKELDDADVAAYNVSVTAVVNEANIAGTAPGAGVITAAQAIGAAQTAIKSSLASARAELANRIIGGPLRCTAPAGVLGDICANDAACGSGGSCEIGVPVCVVDSTNNPPSVAGGRAICDTAAFNGTSMDPAPLCSSVGTAASLPSVEPSSGDFVRCSIDIVALVRFAGDSADYADVVDASGEAM